MFCDLTTFEDDKYKFQHMTKYYEPDRHKDKILEPTHIHRLVVYKKLNGKNSIFGYVNSSPREDIATILRSHNFSDEDICHLFDFEIEEYREYAPAPNGK